jgi:hypothetical protein
MSNEVWVVFRGQIMAEGDCPPLENVDQIVEIIKAEKISKSYVKLTESPFYHPNVSFGDILKVAPCTQEFDNRVAVIEFSGVVDETENELEGLGSNNVTLNEKDLEEMMNINERVKPIVVEKFNQGLVYEPTQLISHGTYKINISYEIENNNDLHSMKNYFNTYDAVFQTSRNKKFGSVGFSKETKFEKAVKCLEEAPNVVGCFIAFNPKEFPKIGFDKKLIPKKEEE